VIALPEIAMAQVSVSITLAPPALPVYEQQGVPCSSLRSRPSSWNR
jgi:hypothetical protein